MYPSSFPSSPVGNSLRTFIHPPWSPSKSLKQVHEDKSSGLSPPLNANNIQST